MACSSRKVLAPEPLPAIERYDGVAFRVVMRLRRMGQFPQDVEVLILSAKHGLIWADHPIQDYDLRMTTSRAQNLADHNCTLLGQIVESSQYDEVFISASKVYLLALEPFDSWQRGARVTTNKGRIGCQLQALKAWLLRAS